MKYILLFITSLSLAVSQVLARECGKQHVRSSPDQFIIGGNDAHDGEFPLYVSYMSCGGALIRNNWVLTAAHCLMGLPDLDKTNETIFKTAYVGLLHKKDRSKHQFKVLKKISHEHFNFSVDYDKQTFEVENDIGLLKIDTSHLKLKDKLMPICLPNINVAMTDQCWITGFGNDNKTNNPTTLQKLKDWVTEDQKCLHINKYFNPTQQICIGGTAKGGSGACGGDSGSAFQCKGTDGRFYTLGLTSTTIRLDARCAQPHSPDIYTRVSHYLGWIEKTIKENS